MHLEGLSNKVVGEIEFIAKSHIHIGEHEPGSSLLRLMRLPSGLYIIPASSWKGCLRSIAEKLAPSLLLVGPEKLALKAYAAGNHHLMREDEEFNEYLKELESVLLRAQPPSIIAHNKSQLLSLLKDLGYTEITDTAGKSLKENLHRIALDYLAFHCPVGRLFGNHVIASTLRPHDTFLKVKDGDLEIRPGVGIDRLSGTSKGDILFFTQVLPIGLPVKLRLVIDNVRPGSAESRLLAGVFDWIDKIGLQVGGRKSVGLGLLKMTRLVFFLADLKKSDGWKTLANPLRYGARLTFGEFKKWVTSE